MRNDILKVIKKQNWGALEHFGFGKKNGDRKMQNFLRKKNSKKIPRRNKWLQ